ncbi:MAG TPA: right-handed parallel beta-helix repeat-containing protein [Chitinophaga sp.]
MKLKMQRLLLFLFAVCLALVQPGKYAFGASYYIDPINGNDSNSGSSRETAWKTFRRVNQLNLLPGDAVEIMQAGAFHESLLLRARGTEEQPVTVNFAPGRYDFYPEGAIRKRLHISNTNDRPDELKAIAIIMDSCSHVAVSSNRADLIFRGKMIMAYMNSCDHTYLVGFNLDYQRPTVSELTVTNVSDHYADVNIHRDSKFSIEDSLLTWIGEGWSHRPGSYWQVFDTVRNELSRTDISVEGLRFSVVDENKVRIHFRKNPGFREGCIYQNRDVTRDCAGIFMEKSHQILLSNIRVYFMHGMGIVSQYCGDIIMKGIRVRPRENSGRTCAAWADILHFSGCSGMISIYSCYLSAANDDAINIHGTYLKIVKIPAPNKVQVRFMHGQTYGFDAFAAQDSIAFVQTASLLAVDKGQVAGVEKINDKEFVLTLKGAVPGVVKTGDVVENISATPEVWIHHTTIARIPTRGILATTRHRVLIEDNNFERVHMSAVFVNGDASGWYESGMVRDVKISHNNFRECGEPVINVHPENMVFKSRPVHENIAVTDNVFTLRGKGLFSAKSTGNITLSGNVIHGDNTVKGIDGLLRLDHCSGVKITNNRLEH